MTKTIIWITAGIILLAAGASGSGGEEILGIWNNEDGRAKIEITRCGGHGISGVSATLQLPSSTYNLAILTPQVLP